MGFFSDLLDEVVDTAIDVVTAPVRVVTKAPDLAEDLLDGEIQEGTRKYVKKVVRPRSEDNK